MLLTGFVIGVAATFVGSSLITLLMLVEIKDLGVQD